MSDKPADSCHPDPTFLIATDRQSITFQPCGLTSHNAHDVSERYCGKCHRFLPWRRERPAGADGVAGPTVVRLPVPDLLNARDALTEALNEETPLTNVIVLSQREDGSIYHLESDGMLLKDVLWLVESYKQWFMSVVTNPPES